MLRKLLKYEFKSTARLLGILYLAILACALVLGLVIRPSIKTINGQEDIISYMGFFSPERSLISAITIIYVILLLAMTVMTILLIIYRFYKNLLKDEGYLMHTLPVPTWMLICSKLIVAFIWELIAAGVTLLSLYFISLGSGSTQLILNYMGDDTSWKYVMSILYQHMGLVILCISCVVMTAVQITLRFYFSLSLGNLASWHKFAFAVLSFIIVTIVISVIGYHMQNNILSWSIFGSAYPDGRAIPFERSLAANLIANAIYSAVFFAGSTWILRNHLNLE